MENKSVIFIVAFLLFLLSSGLAMFPAASAEDSNGTGPWVDKLLFNVIEGDDQQVLGLLNNEIDGIADITETSFLPTLAASPNIAVESYPENGYGYISINSAKYPLNITAFRRALAFALDKQDISEDIFDGLALPQDSLIPNINPWSVEGELPYTYYEENTILGNSLLDDAGFTLDGITGFRLSPNGNPFSVTIECDQSSSVAIETGFKVTNALYALDVNAVIVFRHFSEYLNRLYFHGDYDIAFLSRSFTDFDVDWIATEYWSDFADEPYYNFPNWRNATFDSWRNQLLYSTDYEEVYEAAIEMQKIFVYESPIIVCYENLAHNAYRTDRFEGHVIDSVDGIPSWWTNQKVHLKESEGGPQGGTFRWNIPLDIISFNPFIDSSYSAMKIFEELYDSLLKRNPDGTLQNWLAETYTIETHSHNADVLAGHTRFTFNLVQNATWTDNAPLTAQDVAFTFNYLRDHELLLSYNFATDLYAAYAPTDYVFVIEFMTESYWHLPSIAEVPIIPKHQWMLLDPMTYLPDFDELVTSGPYFVSDYVAGDYTELTKYANYFKLPFGSSGGELPPNIVLTSSSELLSVESEDQIVEYAERLFDDISIEDKLDPILRSFVDTGKLSQDVVRTADNAISVLLFLSQTTDFEVIEQFTDVSWKVDLKGFQIFSASIEDVIDFSKLESIEGVNYIQADTYLSEPEIDETAPDMFEIGDVIGRTGTYASDYDGTGSVVGVVDEGADFSLPDMKDAIYIDADGNPGCYDPTGYGLTEMYVGNRSFIDDVNGWLADGNLLTYESGGKYYLNVTGWDPEVNMEGGRRHLMGLLPPYGDSDPYGSVHGFIGLYEWAWGITNGSEFVSNEMWKDWEIPSPGTNNYTFGWASQQRRDGYAKIFAPSMILDGDLIIDWNGTLAWNYMWDYAFYYESIDLTNQADRDMITDIMDWSFVDDISEGYFYGVGSGSNPVLSADLDDDGMDDIGIGSLCWALDNIGYLSPEIDDFFCGIATDGLAWSAMFAQYAHGAWTSSAVASRGVFDHEDIYSDRTDTFNLPGIANGSKVIAVKGITLGNDYGALFWAAGFHFDESSGYFNYTTEGAKHKADIISNSWSYTNGPCLSLSYMALTWDLLSVPGIIDASYPGTLFLVSSGNSGADYMTNGAPDSAFSVISVGGTTVTHAVNDLYEDNQAQLNQEAWFASNGPSLVGVVKPDIVAPSIFGRSPNAFHNVWLDVEETFWGTLDPSSSWWSGTSLATPIAAGATALILEVVRDNLDDDNWYDPQVLKNILMSTAADIGIDPFIQGHGLIDIESAVDYILNGGGYLIETDSFSEYADVMADAWDYWMPGTDIFGIEYPDLGEPGGTPVGLESSSFFFGNVYRSGTYDVEITIVDLNDLSTTSVSSDFTDFDPWYYSMSEQFSYTVETRAQVDTNIYDVLRGDVIDLSSLLSSAELTSFNDAQYVTITAGFDESIDDIELHVWDYFDRNSDGVTNFWYNSSYPGDDIQWVSRDTSTCNNLIARLSQPDGSTVSDLFTNTPVVQFEDPMANDISGNPIKLTFTIWERVADASISFVDDTSFTTATLTVLSDAEYGIHQGSIHVIDSGGYTHEIPYSYMVIFEADGAYDEVMTLVDGWGDELTPYDNGAWSASFSDYAGNTMDGGGHRTFAIEIPNGPTVIVLRAEWEHPGTVVDMCLRDNRGLQIIATDDGFGPPFNPTPTSELKNAIVWDEGNEINGTYILELSIHTFNGSSAYENITITLQTYSSLGEPSVDPTWTSNNSPVPASITADDILTGDHIIMQNVWSLTTPTNFPEYSISSSQISFLTGPYYENNALLTDPQGVDAWSIPLTGTNFLWETVNDIQAGDSVEIEIYSVCDTAFDVYKWNDTNIDGQVQTDELMGGSIISIDTGGEEITEIGSFAAYDDMNIAIRVFAYAYSYSPGDSYTLIVDRRVSTDAFSLGDTVLFDTYDFGMNVTRDVEFTGWTDTDIVFTHTLGEVTFNNFFCPDVTLLSPNGGETWTSTNFIVWTSTSQSVDYDPEHEVYVSNDNGATFMLIGRGLDVTFLSWDVSSWQIGNSYVVKAKTLDRGLADWDVSDASFTAGEVPVVPTAPLILGVESISYPAGETGNEVSWFVYDNSPSILQIWIDDALFSEPVWDTLRKNITISSDGLLVGEHNYTLYAEDAVGASTSFTTMVIVYPSDPPSIDHPVDYSYVLSTTGHEITWIVSDDSPDSYIIERNDTTIETDEWDGSSITVSIDGLAVGVYSYVLTVNNTYGYVAFDEVIVTVYFIPPTIDHPADYSYVLSTTGHEITWIVSGDPPDSYVIERNGSIIESDEWDGSSITVSIDGLAVGVYSYVLTVNNTYGYVAFDEVIVTVYLDTIPPLIDHPDDITYLVGITGNTITWNPNDDNPSNYEIYKNSIIFRSGLWNSTSESVSISVDGLSVGEYEYSIIVQDIGGNNVIDTVTVTVVSSTSTTTHTTQTNTTETGTLPGPGDILLTITIVVAIGSVIVIVVIVIIMKKVKT